MPRVTKDCVMRRASPREVGEDVPPEVWWIWGHVAEGSVVRSMKSRVAWWLGSTRPRAA